MAKAKAAKSSMFPLLLALLTGGAVAAICMMLPGGVLESIVVASGLPGVLAAAEPPLGMTARALVAGVGGLAVAAAVWALLTALDRLPKIKLPSMKRGSNGAMFARPVEAPRPDAPVEPVVRRRPILAGADLGMPFDSVTEKPKPILAEKPVRAPAAVEDAPIALTPPEPVEEIAAPILAEVEAEPEIVAPIAAEPEPEESIAPEPVMAAQPPRPLPATQSLTTLVDRLEAGFDRRRLALVSSREEPVRGAPPAPDIDAALRDALGTLQRMTARR